MNTFVQLLINILISTGTTALIASSFALIFSATRFFHFAHGIVCTLGAFFTYFFISQLKFSLLISIPLSLVCSAAIGIGMEKIVYRKLRNASSSSLVMLLASLGLYIALQNIISVAFGDDVKIIRHGDVREGYNLLGGRITGIQLVSFVTSILILMILYLLIKTTKFGKTVRAISSNNALANVVGIRIDTFTAAIFAIGSSMAGLAGILVALDIDMTPDMGMNMLMTAVVAMIVGGFSNQIGIIFGSLLLSSSQHLAAYFIGSEWEVPSAFIILVIFLLFRPYGFFGKKPNVLGFNS